MLQYTVNLHRAVVMDGPLHWAVSSHDEDLIEVGTYEEAVELACDLAGAEAILSSESTEVIVEAYRDRPARRIVFTAGEDPSERPVGTLG